MPNALDIALARERWRSRFRAYWKKDTPYRQKKREANRAYGNASFARLYALYIRRRNRLGLIPLFDVLRMTGLSRTVMRGLARRAVIPGPIRYRGWHCYSVEQVACLTQAVLHATIDEGYSSFFSQEKCEEFIRNNWPDWEAVYGKGSNTYGNGDGGDPSCVADPVQPGR